MKKVVGLLVVALLLVMVSPVWAAPPAAGVVKVQAVGPIEELDPGAGTFVVDGVTFTIDEETWIHSGGEERTLEDLEIGTWVRVTGFEGSDGTLVARCVCIDEDPEDPEEPEEPGEPPEGFEHPVAARIAEGFGLEYDEVMALHEDGIGFGLIIKAYGIAEQYPESGLTGADLLEMKLEGQGWGEICREFDMHPGHGPPPWAGNGNDRTPPGQGGDGPPGHGGNGNPPGHSRPDHPGKGHGNPHR